jgi:hypothetical protein
VACRLVATVCSGGFFGQAAKCDIAHIPLSISSVKSDDIDLAPERVAHMAPKPEAIRLTRLTFIFGMAVAAAMTILMIVTWAQVNSTPIYQPQYLLVY